MTVETGPTARLVSSAIDKQQNCPGRFRTRSLAKPIRVDRSRRRKLARRRWYHGGDADHFLRLRNSTLPASIAPTSCRTGTKANAFSRHAPDLVGDADALVQEHAGSANSNAFAARSID